MERAGYTLSKCQQTHRRVFYWSSYAPLSGVKSGPEVKFPLWSTEGADRRGGSDRLLKVSGWFGESPVLWRESLPRRGSREQSAGWFPSHTAPVIIKVSSAKITVNNRLLLEFQLALLIAR